MFSMCTRIHAMIWSKNEVYDLPYTQNLLEKQAIWREQQQSLYLYTSFSGAMLTEVVFA